MLHPKLIICVVTFNQREFITSCLESLASQATNFNFLILVADDCSTDGTSHIIEQLTKKYPDTIRHIRHDQNLGTFKNYRFIHEYALSLNPMYIAHMDGDDRACPGKLMAQVEILDRDREISISAHAVRVYGQDRIISADGILPVRGDLRSLLTHSSYFVNSSTMYRACNGFSPRNVENTIDFFVHVHHASLGKIHLDKRVFGEYRWNSGGISKDPVYQGRIEKAYDEAFDLALERGADPDEVIRCRLSRRKSFAIAALSQGDRASFYRLIELVNEERMFAGWKHRLLSDFRGLVRGPLASYVRKRYSA